MNVIFVFDTLDLGGAERQGVLLARYLKSEGARVEVWGLTGKPGAVATLCDESEIPWRAVELHWERRFLRSPVNVRALRRLALDLRARSVDVLLPYTYFSNVIASLVWRSARADLCVWNQRDAGQFLDAFDPWRSLATRLVRHFVANSEHGARALVAHGVPSGRVTVVHNGVELRPPVADRAVWRKRLGADGDQFIVGMVANVHANKDHATLVRAWRRVVDVDGFALLALAGRIEETGDAIRELVSELRLEQSVRFLGPVMDVSGFYASIDVLAHAAISEGLPNAILEGMAAGLPVVATDLPGIREVVGADGYRWLTPPGDAPALAEKLLQLSENAQLRADVGGAGSQRILREFSAPAMCETMAGYISDRLPER